MWNRSSFCLKVQKIISGGQTGVDRAGLDVALDLGLAVGGWCPKGRRAEDRRIPDRYPLMETPERITRPAPGATSRIRTGRSFSIGVSWKAVRH